MKITIDFLCQQSESSQYEMISIVNVRKVRTETSLERMRGIEPPSQPWQGRIRATKLHPQFLEGLVGFEPTIRELQSHALPLGYRPKVFELPQKDNS